MTPGTPAITRAIFRTSGVGGLSGGGGGGGGGAAERPRQSDPAPPPEAFEGVSVNGVERRPEW